MNAVPGLNDASIQSQTLPPNAHTFHRSHILLLTPTLLCCSTLWSVIAANPQTDVSGTSTTDPAQAAQEALPEFDLLRPEGMQNDSIGPVLLALPPGDQSRAMVNAAHDLYWRDEALRQGWTVVSPIAPTGEVFRGDNLSLLHNLLTHIENTYAVEGGKVHLAGVSNGGRSAFELALRSPDRFASLSALPGMPDESSFEQLERLAGLPVAMYVGGDDEGWRDNMERAAERMRELNIPLQSFTIFEGESHTPKSLNGTQLFNSLERFRVARVLEDFHAAASEADGQRYFDHFAPSAIFMGTDGSERWNLEAFHAFADPYFSEGKGWTYTALERSVFLSPDGNFAWFDESLNNASYGDVRGSGVLLRQKGRWKIVQYNLSIPLPNDLTKSIIELVRQAEHEAR